MNPVLLRNQIKSMSDTAEKMLVSTRDKALSLKEREERLGRSAITFSLNEVKGLPLMTPLRVSNAITLLEAEGRTFERDTSRRTLPYLFTVADVRDIYSKIGMPSFSQSVAAAVTGGHPEYAGARVIAGLNLKGGVGKTTLVSNMATGFIYSHNMIKHQMKVLLIDMDPQGSCSLAFGFADQHTGAGQVCSATQAIMQNINADDLKSWIKPTSSPGLDILPAFLDDAFFSVAAYDIAASTGIDMASLLEHFVIAPLRDQYDVILIDCGPHMDAGLLNVMNCADSIIVPVGLDLLEYDSTLKFISRLPGLFDLCPSPRIKKENIRFIATKMDENNPRYLAKFHELISHWPTQVFNASMPQLRAFAVTYDKQETVYDVPGKHYAGSVQVLQNARMAMDRIVNECFASVVMDGRELDF